MSAAVTFEWSMLTVRSTPLSWNKRMPLPPGPPRAITLTKSSTAGAVDGGFRPIATIATAPYAAWLEETPKFIDITMPEQFVLEAPTEADGWIDHGVFRAADFDP